MSGTPKPTLPGGTCGGDGRERSVTLRGSVVGVAPVEEDEGCDIGG